MKLPRLFRGYAAAPQGDVNAPPAGEAGADGDELLEKLSAGGPDVNPELTGAAKFAVYDEMRKTDATIKSTLHFVKLPVRSASWGLNPADETPEAKVVRDFCAWNLGLEEHDGELDLSWDETLQNGLTMLDFGACIEELVWGDVRTWRDADGDEHLVRPLARLAPRLPTTIQEVHRKAGVVTKVKQNLPNTDPIPGEKISHLVWEREGARWDGVSLIRPAWGPWTLKKHILIVTGIGWDRFATGLPVIYHPATADGEQTAKSIGRNIRTHERGYVHFPSEGPGMNGRPESDWFLEVLNAAQTIADPTPLLKYLSDQEAEVGLANFARQGLGETGARATAEAQIDPYYLAVEALAQGIRRERSRQVLRKLVEVNFGSELAMTHCPTLTVSKIRARNVQVIANAIAVLSEAGFAFTDREAEDDVREMLALPRLPNDLDRQGIPRDRLEAILQGLGLDPETLAQIVAALPDDVGLARNRVPAEGNGLAR